MADNPIPDIPNFAGVLMPQEPAPVEGFPELDLRLPADHRGSFGGVSFEDNLSAQNDKFRAAMSRSFDPNFMVQPVRYDDPAYANLEGTFNDKRGDLFDKLGFYPGRNNEDRYARSLDNWQKLGIAFDQMGALAKETFVSQWKTEADFWGNLVTGNVKEAFLPFGDAEELKNMYDAMQDATRNNYVPLTYEEQQGEWGFGKFATALGQFGFTLGTIGAFGTQMALEWGAALLLAPETGLTSIFAQAGNTGNKIRQLFTLSRQLKNLERMENGVETVGKIRQAYNYLSDSKNMKAGFGKFYGFTKQYNAAAGEAKFEAAFSLGEYTDRRMQEARDQGKILTYSDMQQIEQDGMKIAKGNGITNTGLLFMMNKLNMGNLFRGPFNPQRRFMSELLPEAAGRGLVKTSAKGWMPKFDVSMFSKEGLKSGGLKSGRWLLDSSWEGVQEVAQGISGKYWDQYYTDQYDRKSRYDRMSLLGRTISEHLDSPQAFEEFISGLIVGGPGAVVNMAMGKVAELPYRDQIKQQKEYQRGLAAELNKFEQDVFRVFDPRVANLNNQSQYAKDMDEAVKRNDLYAYKNLQHKQMRDMIMLGIKTGKLDYMIGLMDDQVKNLTPEEFKEVFDMVDDATNRKTAADYVNLFKQEAEQIVKEHDKVKQKFPNPFGNFGKLKKDSPEYVDQALRYQGWEEATQELIFERRTYADVLKRMKGILTDAQGNLGSALYNPFFTLTSKQNTDREISVLQAEVDALNAATALDEQGKKLLADKQDQLKKLQAWSKHTTLIDADKMAQRDEFNESLARFTDEARDSFKAVLQAYQQTNPDAEMLTDEQIEEAYTHVIDFARLQKDSNAAIRNISYLTSTDGFGELYDRHYGAAEAFYKSELARRDSMVKLKEGMLAALEFDQAFAQRDDVRQLRAKLDIAVEDRDYLLIDDIVMDMVAIYQDMYKVEAPVEQPAEQPAPEDPNAAPPAAPAPLQPGSLSGTNRIYNRLKLRIDVATTREALDKISSQLSDPGKLGISVTQAEELQQLVDAKYAQLDEEAIKQSAAGDKLFAEMNANLDAATTEEQVMGVLITVAPGQGAGAKQNQNILSQDQIDKILEKGLAKINDIKNGIVSTGTPTAGAGVTFDQLRSQIAQAASLDELKGYKETIEKNFTGAEKQQLLQELVDKSSTFVGDTSTQSFPVNQTHDMTDVDSFDASVFENDLNDLSGTATGPATPTQSDPDDDIFDAFKSCNVPPSK